MSESPIEASKVDSSKNADINPELRSSQMAARERNLRDLRDTAFDLGILDAKWRAQEIAAGRL